MNPRSAIIVLWPRFGPYHIARLEATARRFAREGWNVVGLEVALTDDTYAWTIAEHDASGSFERITLFPDANYHAIAPRAIARAVETTLDRIAPQAVAIVGWSFPEARAALRWCRQRGAATICMSDSKVDDCPRSWLKEWSKRQLVRLFDGALVAGKPHADYVTKLGIAHDRIEFGVDVVDNLYFQTAANQVRLEASHWRRALSLPERYFFSCGRFVPKKNLLRLLESYAAYRRSSADAPWDLVVAGGGDQDAELRQLAARLELRGVHWPGFLQIDTLPAYYALASAFILPSTSEQWGLVVNEAMACGLPVLVSRLAGCRYELVDEPSNGYLFDPYNIEDMASCIHRFAELPDTHLQFMGRESEQIIAHWGVDRFADSLWQLTSGICNLSRGTSQSMNAIGWLATHPRFLSRAAK